MTRPFVTAAILAVLSSVLGACDSDHASPELDSGTTADGSRSADGSMTADGGSAVDGSSADSCSSTTCGGSESGVGPTPAGLLDPAYTTQWNPGILTDTPTGSALGADGLPVRATTCISVPVTSGDATSVIQSALNGCEGKNQVVLLAAGTYSVSSTVNVPSGVILRGAGPSASGTVIVSTHGGPVLSIGTTEDTVCYNSGFDSSTEPLLTEDATKETATLTVASVGNFKKGDLALVDEEDTSEVDEGDCDGDFKRMTGYGISERVEVSAVSGNTLTLTTPLHWTFTTAQKAQVSRFGTAPTTWAGIEDVLVQGGRPGAYAGQSAGGIDVSNAAYCWVKNVQVDGTTSGMGIRLAGTYRSVIRDSHVHNSYLYGFDEDNYGLVIACGAADNLVENNIARFMNKPVLFNVSGGGNVVGYNYADNSWSYDGNNDDGSQELNIDCHCAFPHMELMEGNWAPHMGASITHGNAGYLTYFRNYASSQWAPSTTGQSSSAIVWGLPFAPQYSNVGSLQFDSPDLDMTVIGNVLGSATATSLGTTSTGQGASAATSQNYTGSNLAIFIVDTSMVPWSSIWLTGNFDTVNDKIMWNASPLTASLPTSTETLPASLYRKSKPGWWPSGSPWPWVGPDLTPMVGSLPAETLSSAYNYYDGADGSCTVTAASDCCAVSGGACSGL
jgi:hypothetical protein